MLSSIDLTIWVLVLAVPGVLLWGRLKHWKAFRMIAMVGLAAYSAALIGVAFGPIPVDSRLIAELRVEVDLQNNLKPLASILGIWQSQPAAVVARQVGGNFILLAPLGVLLPSLFESCQRFGRTVAIGVTVALSIEVVQLAISGLLGFTYKLLDVDDILLNTSGVAIGWAIWWILSSFLPLRTAQAAN